jgi:hypothetical protein
MDKVANGFDLLLAPWIFDAFKQAGTEALAAFSKVGA